MFACHADDPGSTPGRCKCFLKKIPPKMSRIAYFQKIPVLLLPHRPKMLRCNWLENALFAILRLIRRLCACLTRYNCEGVHNEPTMSSAAPLPKANCTFEKRRERARNSFRLLLLFYPLRHRYFLCLATTIILFHAFALEWVLAMGSIRRCRRIS